ncbi:amidase [Diplodia corticola]|uniref:Amidase n=1 Tax=Diplodia corticola TaxID=236234 RepID=A0A1J9QUJ5_9PEZI|nr:amidase [Diplodia corticola]OJD32112.1 amidase [Diplodia corticola]
MDTPINFSVSIIPHLSDALVSFLKRPIRYRYGDVGGESNGTTIKAVRESQFRTTDKTLHHNAPSSYDMTLNIVEASIADLQHALSTGLITSVSLCTRYLLRISTYDSRGPTLNAIPILNPSVLHDAAESDERRAADKAAGRPSRPLEGIPYMVKDSYAVRGLTVASGSPAFTTLVAPSDAFTVAQLRAAGAVLLGKTNTPPMAAGGMHRGAYGRAESPYNASYLTAAFASGSSNGSATSTAASFAAFGMAEETVSSGRSPASNNGLVAYTPSRGVISIRGNWPLYPTCDVVVPHTRTVGDLLAILDVLCVPDPEPAGDFWREQPWIPIPSPTTIRPAAGTFVTLADADALRGKRVAVPRMYIGHPDADGRPVALRASIAALFFGARRTLEALGAELVETDFPIVANYEALQDVTPAEGGTVANVPGLPAGWMAAERGPLLALAWDAFLKQNGGAESGMWDFESDVDAAKVFPMEEGGPQTRYANPLNAIRWHELPQKLRECRDEGVSTLVGYPGMEEALRALEAARKRDLEGWMDAEGVDLVCFPANGGVGRADADTVEESAREAWRNGVMYSNGNRVLRHLGVPTVSVAMGVMEDTGMPCNLTFAGKAYEDQKLLSTAWAFEKAHGGRVAAPRTPPLESDVVEPRQVPENKARGVVRELKAVKSEEKDDGSFILSISGRVDSQGERMPPLRVFVDGEDMSGRISIRDDGVWQCTVKRAPRPSPWHPEYLKEAGVTNVLLEKTLVLVVVGGWGLESGDVLVVN